jgi:tetratricopeptide (TPR) repeat protein
MSPPPQEPLDSEESSPSLLERANHALAQNNLDLAIQEYSRLIDEDPNRAGGYLGRGVALRRQGKFDESLSDYNKAIELEPSPGTYLNRGNLKGQLGDHDAALADLNKAIELQDGSGPIWPAYQSRAGCYFLTSRYELALADYQEVIRINPDYSDAYHGAAKIWATCPDHKLRDGKLAVRYAAKANELWQEQKRSWCPEYMETLIAAFNENRSFESAINLANGILKKEGPDRETKTKIFRLLLDSYRYRAHLLEEAGDYVSAIADLTTLVNIVPTDGEAYMARSAAHGKIGDHESAQADLKRSLDLVRSYFDEIAKSTKPLEDGSPGALVPLSGCHILFHEKTHRPFVMRVRPLTPTILEQIPNQEAPNAWYEFIRSNNRLSAGEKIACLQRAVILDQQDPGWWYTLGCHYELEGKDWYGAANAFNHVVFLNPKSGVAWFSLSQLWAGRGFMAKARECNARFEALPHF